MQNILVVLTALETAEAVFTAAIKFGELLDHPHYDLLHPRPDVDPDFMPTEEVYTDDRRLQFDQDRDRLFEGLQHLLAGRNAGELPTIRQERGDLKTIIEKAAVSADLIVLGSPHADRDAKAVLDTALLKESKAVLIVSRNLPASLCTHIAIAWEDELPARRALDAILPVIRSAHRTTILIGTEGTRTADPPAELIEILRTKNQNIEVRRFQLKDRHIGEALLSEAHDVGADILVMGAFFHSRLRETLLGGATMEILKDLDLPVLLHH